MYDRNNFIIGTGSPIYNMLFILKKNVIYIYLHWITYHQIIFLEMISL